MPSRHENSRALTKAQNKAIAELGSVFAKTVMSSILRWMADNWDSLMKLPWGDIMDEIIFKFK